MNHLATDFLQALYGARYEQIVFLPHGVHDIPFTRPPARKERLGGEGPVLMTFGLLSRVKGIETGIDAMAEIVRERPEAIYAIVGQTHPRIVEAEGESYRTILRGRAKRLGLENNIKFVNEFADLSDLIGYLGETDIFLAPYTNLDQMTSGALAYAAGAGKAIVATPFIHARDLLDEGRGRIAPANNPRALARHVLDLLDNPRKTNEMRRRIYRHTRSMVWDAVAARYLDLFDSVRQPEHRTVPLPKPVARPAAHGRHAGRTAS
jgi:glycosyltransferase involved in cell wall biosynthesis